MAVSLIRFPSVFDSIDGDLVAAEWRNPWAVISPTPERAACETNTESVDDTQHQRTARQRLVYTEVYTDIENSGRLSPRASNWSQPQTTPIGRICPALST
jgi:hypothetical protein